MSTEPTDLHEKFARDGVVFVEHALDDDALARAQAAFEWSVANPGPAGMHAYAARRARSSRISATLHAGTATPIRICTTTPRFPIS